MDDQIEVAERGEERGVLWDVGIERVDASEMVDAVDLIENGGGACSEPGGVEGVAGNWTVFGATDPARQSAYVSGEEEDCRKLVERDTVY